MTDQLSCDPVRTRNCTPALQSRYPPEMASPKAPADESHRGCDSTN